MTPAVKTPAHRAVKRSEPPKRVHRGMALNLNAMQLDMFPTLVDTSAI